MLDRDQLRRRRQARLGARAPELDRAHAFYEPRKDRHARDLNLAGARRVGQFLLRPEPGLTVDLRAAVARVRNLREPDADLRQDDLVFADLARLAHLAFRVGERERVAVELVLAGREDLAIERGLVVGDRDRAVALDPGDRGAVRWVALDRADDQLGVRPLRRRGLRAASARRRADHV